MKFAAPYILNCPIEVNEYNILYKKDNSEESLNNFFEQTDKRINIKFVDDTFDISKIKIFNKLYDNLYVRLDWNQGRYIDELKENNIKFFFDSDIKAFSYHVLDWLINNGVTDVYISDDLCYNMFNVWQKCEENNVKIRMELNRIPSLFAAAGNDPKAFIPRPEDYYLLSQYVSVGEFDLYDTPKKIKYNWGNAKVLYEHWFVSHSWGSDLRLLNKDIEMNFPNMCIVPYFSDYKSNCGYHCSQRNQVCSFCQRNYNDALLMYEKGLKYK